MGDKHFWSIIEYAWQSVGGKVADRQKLAAGKLSEAKAYALEEVLDDVMEALHEVLDQRDAEELMAFDRILERKLYDIDRQDVHEYLDGSDDGFLYARGFIVAAGKWYYDAVNADPSVVRVDFLECEQMCYVSWHLYHDKFGEMPESGISRESCSNTEAWRDE